MELWLVTGAILCIQIAAGYVSKSWMVGDYDFETRYFYGRDEKATLIASTSYKIFGQFYNKFFISARGLISLANGKL